jgi:pimeloyl-ACP methyl ester carboxylesterase
MAMAELVFVHGAGDSSAIWERQIEHFGRRHRVVAVDLPGHGQRLNETAHDDHDRNADELARHIRDNGLSHPVLVGHSMGGAVVLSLALRQPFLAGALVLAASGARLRMGPEYLETARQKAETSPSGQVAGPSVPMDVTVSPATPADSRAWLAERIGQSSAQATYADFVANDRFDVMERLGEVRQPTLVLGGEVDKMTPPKFQSFLAERMPHARLVLLPNAGHYVQIERQAEFNQELERFLAELDDGPWTVERE